MKDKKGFYQMLSDLDRHPIADYQQLVGDYDFTRYVIKCLPFKEDSEKMIKPVFSIRIPQTIAEMPEYLFDNPVRRTALENLLLRNFHAEAEKLAHFDRGGIAQRHILMSSPGQTILPRNALQVNKEYIEVRIEMRLPVQPLLAEDSLIYVIDGKLAKKLFFEDLMESIENSLLYCNITTAEADRFVNTMEDADQLRKLLRASGQIGFVAAGTLLGRDAHSDLPDREKALSLEVDESAQEEASVPHAGTITGFSVPDGLTLIIGEMNSGRIELMDALAQGIYNHIPGDGRENVVAVTDAVEIRSEVGRPVQNVDISAFVGTLPDGSSPGDYSTASAGAFESQAAAAAEALEVGARVLLFDEQSSCPTFLSSDSRISGLMGDLNYSSLATRARRMVDELGVSILVAGSNVVTEFIPIADKVFKIERCSVRDITEEAKALGIAPALTHQEAVLPTLLSRSRWIMSSSVDPGIGLEDVLVEVGEDGSFRFGRSLINLDGIRQIASPDQIRSIGLILYYAKLRYMDEGYSLRDILDLVDRDLSNEGLIMLAREVCGNLARPRRYEVAALLNRLPSFRVSHVTT